MQPTVFFFRFVVFFLAVFFFEVFFLGIRVYLCIASAALPSPNHRRMRLLLLGCG